MTAPQISATVVGVVDVTDALRAAPVDRRARVARAIRRAGIELSNHVKRMKLTGQVLNVRTGRLRASINNRFTDDGAEISTLVGTAVPYAARFELGFTGVESVRDHVRKVKSRDKFGKGRKTKKNQTSQGIAFVRAHSRRVNQAPRPFLQPSLEDRRAAVVQSLIDAVTGD